MWRVNGAASHIGHVTSRLERHHEETQCPGILPKFRGDSGHPVVLTKSIIDCFNVKAKDATTSQVKLIPPETFNFYRLRCFYPTFF